AHARWGAASSHRLRLTVRPRLQASRGPIRLFDRTVVTGRVGPPLAGERIDVTLWRQGHAVLRSRPKLDKHGRFRTSLVVAHPGRHSVIVRFQDADHAAAVWRSSRAVTPLPYVHQGSKGLFVRLLQRRLE